MSDLIQMKTLTMPDGQTYDIYDDEAIRYVAQSLNNEQKLAARTNIGAVDETFVNNTTKVAAPRNLLDNSDFQNPVSQRETSRWVLDNICLDRWYSHNALPSISDGFVRIPPNGKLVQVISGGKFAPGRTYTVALGRYTVSSGITVVSAHGTVPDTLPTVETKLISAVSGTTEIHLCYSPETGASVEIINTSTANGYGTKWAALYEGAYTADTMPVYQPKGYNAELAECRNYYRRIGSADRNTILGTTLGYTETSLYFGFPGISMRAAYSVNMVTDISTLQYTSATLSSASPASAIGAYNPNDNSVSVLINGTFERSKSYTLWLAKGVIEISAEL